MRVGLVIPVYGRLPYLRQCFESLKKADLSRISEVVIVDDCSPDTNVWDYLKTSHFANQEVIVAAKNCGVSESLRVGLKRLMEKGCDTFINLDSDAIVSKDFVSVLLSYHKRFPNTIVSGFNTLTRNSRGRERHPVFRNHFGFVEKRTIGGINMCFSKALLGSVILPALRTKGHWDWNACVYMRRKRNRFIVTTPSVVQHIGFESAVGNTDTPDVAHDFSDGAQTQKALISQPRGIGDVIFCQTIAQKLISEGYEVTWPVDEKFLDGLSRAYPAINFIPEKDSPVSLDIKNSGVINGYKLFPIRFSDTLQRVPYRAVMRAKYDMMGMDFTEWSKCAMWKRDEDRENELAELLGAEGEYCLVNTNFTTKGRKAQIPNRFRLKTINIDFIPGFSLFDWAKVIENASEIHTVSTSILYMFEVLDLKCVPSIYIRRPIEKNHSFYDYLFTKPFNYRK